MCNTLCSLLNPFERVTLETSSQKNYHVSSDGRKSPIHPDQWPDAISTHYFKGDTRDPDREITDVQAQWHLKIWKYQHDNLRFARPHPDSQNTDEDRSVRSWGDRYWTLNLKKVALYAAFAGAAYKIAAPHARLPNLAAYVSLAAIAVLIYAREKTLAFVPGGYCVGHLGVILSREIMRGLRA